MRYNILNIAMAIGIWICILPIDAQPTNPLPGDTINVTDAANLKQGMWITYDASGQIIIEKGQYINNKKEGVWIRNYPNGNRKHEITFKNGIANGPAKFFFDNGQLWESGTWVVNKWVGEYVFYHPNGQKAYDWHYNTQGKRTGTQKYFHSNGKLKYTGNWDNGKTVGSLKVYDEEGKLIAERVYEDGKFEKTIGRSNDSIPSEQMHTTTQFTGTGQHTVYNLLGQIEKSGHFVNGNLTDGYQIIYDSNGNATTRLIFEKGNLVKSVDIK
jgi:antitoxin component YwqK of YwqJK toxin-antitoxin module